MRSSRPRHDYSIPNPTITISRTSLPFYILSQSHYQSHVPELTLFQPTCLFPGETNDINIPTGSDDNTNKSDESFDMSLVDEEDMMEFEDMCHVIYAKDLMIEQ